MRETSATILLATAALIAASSTALAHHPSGVSSFAASGPIITIPGVTLEEDLIASWFAFEHISFDELSDAVLESAADDNEQVHSLSSIESPSAGIAYGFTDRLMVSLQLPYVIRTGIREGEHHHHNGEHEDETEPAEIEIVDRGDSEGIGDLTVLGQYRFYGPDAGPQFSVLFGLKTPTGATDERDDEGELFETEFQPGSGSWDGLFGLAATRAAGRWSFDGNVLYTVATQGAQHTDLGDRFRYNGAVSYRILGGSQEFGEGEQHGHHHRGPSPHPHGSASNGGPTIDVALEINGEWQEKQDIAGEIDPNSGGNVVFLSPGFRVASRRWSGFVSVGLPIINDLNGKQSEPEYRLLGGLTGLF
jgi:hypothetical protein